jgi:hypothetical protein
VHLWPSFVREGRGQPERTDLSRGGRRLSRRGFSQSLTLAAIGGLAAGSSFGQDSSKPALKCNIDPTLLVDSEPHVCRGLNSCKGKGKGGGNACAGQGNCATAPTITCSTNNACKGKGGCGGYPGQNTCKGQGECAVPLKKDIWEIARKQYEQMMKLNKRKFGSAPK